MKPSMGRIVIFTGATGEQAPAIVVGVHGTLSDVVDLQIFHLNLRMYQSNVRQADPLNLEPQPLTWQWPPRV